MNRSVSQIILDVQDTISGVVVCAKRGDTGRTIRVSLSDGGYPYSIAEGCSASITARRPDGRKIKKTCQIVGNYIEYDFDDQTCLYSGRLPAEIKLYDPGGDILTSARFLIDVYDSVFFDGEDIPAGDEETVLGKIRSDIENLEKNKIPFDSWNKRSFCIGMDDGGLYITMEGV